MVLQSFAINKFLNYFAELAEVQSVMQAPPQATPVPSKKIDEKAFFDVSFSYVFQFFFF